MRGRFEGCLLGVAIGDAMAATGIGETPNSILQKYGQRRDLVGGGKFNLDPGEYTDEGQMMVSVLESICTLRSFKPDNIAYRFVGWLKSHPKDIGEFTQHVLERIRDGERWQEASEAAAMDTSMQTAGSSTLTYSIPVGLLRSRNQKKITEDTITCARVTHWDNRCTESSVVVNYALSLLTKGEENVFKQVLDFTKDRDPRVLQALSKVESMKFEEIDTSGYCLATLQGAFWFLLNYRSFEDGISKAASLGGQAPDSVAALAGAFLGARYGRVDIPERWLVHLKGRDRIEVLASRLYELSQA